MDGLLWGSFIFSIRNINLYTLIKQKLSDGVLDSGHVKKQLQPFIDSLLINEKEADTIDWTDMNTDIIMQEVFNDIVAAS